MGTFIHGLFTEPPSNSLSNCKGEICYWVSKGLYLCPIDVIALGGGDCYYYYSYYPDVLLIKPTLLPRILDGWFEIFSCSVSLPHTKQEWLTWLL